MTDLKSELLLRNSLKHTHEKERLKKSPLLCEFIVF